MAAASQQHRLAVAVLFSGDYDEEISQVALARKLQSAATFLLPPLRATADVVDAFACLDSRQPEWQRMLVVQHLQPTMTWKFRACDASLSSEQRACCQGRVSADCDNPQTAAGEPNQGMAQFFRLAECHMRVLAHQQRQPYDMYVRARPDLHWVGSFDAANSLLSSTAHEQIRLRYRSCSGIHGLMLGSLQSAWYKVGVDVCTEARWQTEYSCFTVDDQFALVPSAHARRYFGFALERLSREHVALKSRAPEVPACSCWQCVEGRLTEYLLLRKVPLRVLSLPASCVTDDKNAAPFLLPETQRDGVWSPSVLMRCEARNGSWGVAAWLTRSGLLDKSNSTSSKDDTSPSLEARLARVVNVRFSMKALARNPGDLAQLVRIVEQETRPAGLVRQRIIAQRVRSLGQRVKRAVADYSKRYLERDERHERCAAPEAALRPSCSAAPGAGTSARKRRFRPVGLVEVIGAAAKPSTHELRVKGKRGGITRRKHARAASAT